MLVLRTTLLLLLCLAFLCAPSVCADPTRIYTTADSDGDMRTFTYDGADFPQSEEYYRRTRTTASASYQDVTVHDEMYGPARTRISGYAIVQFPIAALHGATLAPNSAKLHVHGYGVAAVQAGVSGANFDFGGSQWDGYLDVYSGNETFDDAPGFPIQAVDYDRWVVGYMPVSGTSVWTEIDVTADLQRQINAGYQWAGYVFFLNDTYSGSAYNAFTIDTYESGANKPYLEIVPEPSSLLALLTGASGLAGMVVRRRK